MATGNFTQSKGSIFDYWRSHAEKYPQREAIIHWVAGETPYRWQWSNLLEASRAFAGHLQRLGVRRGDVCALIMRHHRDFYPIYLGICALGAIPAVLAYPNPRIHPEKFRQGLRGMARRSGLDWFLTERELEPLIRPLVLDSGSKIREIVFPLEWSDSEPINSGWPAPETCWDDPCLLQHSSGTTGLQKAVVLSHGAVLNHVGLYGDAIRINAADKIVSWLPLYHDMGLIAAFYLPLTLGIPVIQIDPFEWVVAPIIFLEAISQERATLSWQPNFAYNLMADRIHEDDLADIRLDSVRMLINCSEPVRGESHAKFLQRFQPYGLRREALSACYAMAEATFAVTQTTPGLEANKLSVDRESLLQGRVAPTDSQDSCRVCVSSGRPLSGCNLRIVNQHGKILPEGQVGEIVIRSGSLFDGYRNNPEKTAEVLRNGWYYSGDYGFLYQGEYYVIGRKKDIIIIAGKNLYPEDVEDAVSEVKGVLPGRAIAFGIEDDISGTEQLCVVAETAVAGAKEQKELRLRIIEACMHIDVTISRVYLAAPRWLIKSSSGKPSRKANKDRALSELTWK